MNGMRQKKQSNPDVHDENKGVVVLNFLHCGLGGEGELQDVELERNRCLPIFFAVEIKT